MKIFPSKFNFTSATKNNKKNADEFQRKSKLAFPIVSPGYISTYYSDGDSFIKTDNSKYLKKLLSHKQYELAQIRKALVYESVAYFEPLEHYYSVFLDTIKKTKLGNCAECAQVAKLALHLNGHREAEICDLFLNIKYIDKKSGEVVYDAQEALDHSFVVAKFKDKKDGRVDKMMIDNWLGFVGDVDDAKAEYKKMSNIRGLLKSALSTHRSLFRVEMAEKTGEPISFDNYKLQSELVFVPTEPEIDEFEYENALKTVKEKFPELIFDKD